VRFQIILQTSILNTQIQEVLQLMGACLSNSKSTKKVDEILRKSIIKRFIPENEWDSFVSIGKQETISMLHVNIHLENNVFLIVLSGEIAASITSTKTSNKSSDKSTETYMATVFKAGDLIHLFPHAQKKQQQGSDVITNGCIQFSKYKLQFITNVNSPQVSVMLFSKESVLNFIAGKPLLVPLENLLNLKIADLCARSQDFKGASIEDLDYLGPLMLLKEVCKGEVLSMSELAKSSDLHRATYKHNASTIEASSGIVIVSGACVAIRDDASPEDFLALRGRSLGQTTDAETDDAVAIRKYGNTLN